MKHKYYLFTFFLFLKIINFIFQNLFITQNVMELVPWTYNNPRVDNRSSGVISFVFQGHVIEAIQNTDVVIDASKNTAYKLWDGAFLLARYLENTAVFPDGFWRGKRCIELGSGCGLVGIVAWLLGADVTLTDLPTALAHTERCLAHNLSRVIAKNPAFAIRENCIRVKAHTWGKIVCDESNEPVPHFDYIFGSDVVYQPSLTSDLLSTLKYFSDVETRILISYKQRGLGEEIFFDEIKKHGFVSNEVSHNFHPPDFKNSDYKIFNISNSQDNRE